LVDNPDVEEKVGLDSFGVLYMDLIGQKGLEEFKRQFPNFSEGLALHMSRISDSMN